MVKRLTQLAWARVKSYIAIYWKNKDLREELVCRMGLLLDNMDNVEGTKFLWFTEKENSSPTLRTMRISCAVWHTLIPGDKRRFMPQKMDGLFLRQLIILDEVEVLNFVLEETPLSLYLPPSLLLSAICVGQLPVLRMLLEKGCIPQRETLEHAICKGRLDMLECLLAVIDNQHLILNPSGYFILLQILLTAEIDKKAHNSFVDWKEFPCEGCQNAQELLYKAAMLVVAKTSVHARTYCPFDELGCKVGWFLFLFCYCQKDHCPFSEEQVESILDELVRNVDPDELKDLFEFNTMEVVRHPGQHYRQKTSILIYTVCIGNKSLARWLLRHGADPKDTVRCEADSAISCLVMLYVHGKITFEDFYEWNVIFDNPLPLAQHVPQQTPNKKPRLE